MKGDAIFNLSRSERGFSVLEAIIAMAILSIAMLPVLTLQMQFTKTTENLERVEQKLSVRDSALNYLKNINLTQVSEGRFMQGELIVTWVATPYESTRTAKSFGGYPGRFNITLYTVRVLVSTRDQKVIDQFEVRSLGWNAIQAADDL